MKQLLCLLTAALAIQALGSEPLIPQPLERFDGKTWSGVTLGVTKDSELKALYPTAGSPTRPEARRVITRGPFIVDTLMLGRGADAIVQAFRVEFTEGEPNLRTLELLYEEAPIRLYYKERYSDWRITAFPKRGVWLFSLGDEPPKVAFLCRAPLMAAMLADTTSKPSPISEVVDPGEEWDRTVSVGDYYVDVRIENTNRPNACSRGLEYSVESQIERQIERLRGIVKFDPRSRGIIRITVTSGRWDNQGRASFTGNASAEFETPYGKIDESSYSSERLSSGFSYRVSDLGFTVLDNLLRDVRNKINRLRPPTPVEMDVQVMKSIYDTLTRP